MIDFIDAFKKTAIALGIAILLPFLVSTGFEVFYPRPKWPQHQENFSPEEQQKIYRNDLERYERYYFYTSAIIGSAALLLGIFLKLGFLGSGFILGGIVTTITGFISYWHRFNRIIQFSVLLLLFILLIAGAYFLVERSRHSKKR